MVRVTPLGFSNVGIMKTQGCASFAALHSLHPGLTYDRPFGTYREIKVTSEALRPSVGRTERTWRRWLATAETLESWRVAEKSSHGTWVAGGCLLADDAKLEKTPFPQPADLQPLPSRDALGPRHAISRLLAQFETFRALVGRHRVTRFWRRQRRQPSRFPRYVGQNDQGPPVVADEPCWNRDGLCNPTEWRRRESNPRPEMFPCELLRT